MSAPGLDATHLPGLLVRGKVRDVYDLGDALLLVATDRISAFDVVLGEPIEGKGVLLTQLTRFWLATLPACTPHHLLYVVDGQHCPAGYEAHRELLRGRAMVCRKANVLPIECVVRGYIVGGGWAEYQGSGSISGVKLPAGLKLAERLPEPLFTPSTKAHAGHDQPVSFEQACERAARHFGGALADGQRILAQARGRALAIYAQAAAHALARGIILADTKFEFGLHQGQLLLVDEVLTPDSSRFWPADEWRPGQNPPSFDKQFIRDYLSTLAWNKRPPPPPIPAEIRARTRQRYLEAYRRLTGQDAPPA